MGSVHVVVALLLGAGITWEERVRDGRAAIRYVTRMVVFLASSASARQKWSTDRHAVSAVTARAVASEIVPAAKSANTRGIRSSATANATWVDAAVGPMVRAIDISPMTDRVGSPEGVDLGDLLGLRRPDRDIAGSDRLDARGARVTGGEVVARGKFVTPEVVNRYRNWLLTA